MPDLKLEITGPDAEAIAAELADQLEQALGVPILPETEIAPNLASEVTRGDPVAIAALVLSIPSAVLAAMDLSKRLDLPRRWQTLRRWARTVGTERGHVRVNLEELETVALDELELERVLAGVEDTD